jgi:hypothetical protein
MHFSTNKDEIKAEIEKLGHKVANVWNIPQYRTKLPLSMFFVDLKPAPNNKTIFDVEILNQCKIKKKKNISGQKSQIGLDTGTY